MSDSKIQELRRLDKTPENVRKLAHELCRTGEHHYSTKYLGHDFTGSEIAKRLGLVQLTEYGNWPAHISTNVEQQTCFFCGHVIRRLTVFDRRDDSRVDYEFPE